MTHIRIRSTLARGLGLLIGALAGSAGLAQQAAAPAADGDVIQQIVVTGSRIERSNLESVSPIVAIGADELRLTGNTTIENTLNEFPQFAAGVNSNVNEAGGSGVLTANLRAMGASRTLVLVNGRRFMPADSSGAVDLASIPDALLERVEVVTGGASAVYGSDAIAGAVNFILKRDFTGIEASFNEGKTFRHDGEAQKFDLTMGTDLADHRGNVVLSGSYTHREPVFRPDRAETRFAYDTVGGKLVPGGSGIIPGTFIGMTSAQRAQLVGVDLTPNEPCTSIAGIRFGDSGTVLPYCTPQDKYNYNAPRINYLQRPLERLQFSTLAHLAINEHAEAYAEAFFINDRNEYEQAPGAISPATPGAPSGTFLIPNYAANPILLPAVRNFFANNAAFFDPDGDGTAAIVGSTRRTDELGPRNHSYERNSYNFTSGLRGDFAALQSTWKWDGFFQFQRTRTDQVDRGEISQTRLGEALNTRIDSSGNVVCVDPAFGCVPASIFGLHTITPAAGAFISPDRLDQERIERIVSGAQISGDLVKLPAGPLGVATGVEYRRDRYEYSPSPLDIAKEYGPDSASPISGSVNVKEVFSEVRIPVLTNLRFADSLTIEGAARLSDYSNAGRVFTWKAGSEWASMGWLRLRGSFNRAIRAPSVFELYSPIQSIYTVVQDPCTAVAHPTAAQQDVCVGQGVSRADLSTFSQFQPGFPARTGGNPGLEPETSDTFTVGAVVTPPWIENATLTVDYFNIKVTNAITAISAGQVLTDCYTRLDPGSETCRAIHRLSNGQIDYVDANRANIAALRVKGVDLDGAYWLPLGPRLSLFQGSGRLAFQAHAGWLFERTLQVVGGLPLDCAGAMGGGCGGAEGNGELNYFIPDFKLNMSAAYISGPLTVNLQERMVGDLNLGPALSAAVTRVPQQWYTDLTARMQFGSHTEISGGIDNVFDRPPPIIGTALAGGSNTDGTLYDVIGRRFFVQATLRF